MILKSIQAHYFRNYESLSLELNPGLNIIVGDNAQGKTNILEAIYFMSTLRSFRTQNDKDLISFDQDYFKVSGEIQNEFGHKKCQIIVFKNGKSIKVNETIIKKSSDYIGLLNCVSFAPNDLNFFSDSPRVRRKFMDIEATKLSNQYLHHLNSYFSFLKQRNALLKQPQFDDELLMILTQQLIDDMWVIVSHRLEIVEFLNQRTQEIFNHLTQSENKIEISLQTEFISQDETEFKKKMMDKMIQNKARDTYFKVTHAGCHRDDLMTLFNDVDINSIASQGQKRLVLISLKLALIEFITAKLKEPPLLLLDDVFSELDQRHQNLFLQQCPKDIQTILTTTSVQELEHLNRLMTIFEVKAGQIHKRRALNG